MTFILGLIISASISTCFYLATGCPNFWYEYNGSCYRIYDEVTNYEGARSVCQNENGYLVIILDEEENAFVKELFNFEGVQGSTIRSAFIGLSDIEQESFFVWSDGSPLNFSLWAPNEPNDHINEDAGVILGPKSSYYGKWNDDETSKALPFVCESKKRTLQVWTEGAFGIVRTALYVDRLVLDVTRIRSKADCLHSCLQRIGCVSANFWPGDHPYNGICILNAATAEEYKAVIATPADLYYGVNATEWIYLELIN